MWQEKNKIKRKKKKKSKYNTRVSVVSSASGLNNQQQGKVNCIKRCVFGGKHARWKASLAKVARSAAQRLFGRQKVFLPAAEGLLLLPANSELGMSGKSRR